MKQVQPIDIRQQETSSKQPPDSAWKADDQRLYFWLPRSEIAFFQSIVESTDNLARIRTEKNTETEALIVLMFSASRAPEVDDLLRYYAEESGNAPKYI